MRVAVAALAISGVIAIGATFDHARKTAAINRADVAAWYCEHGFARRCLATKATSIERRWSVREKSYEAGFAAGLVIFAAAVLKATRRIGNPLER